MPQILTLEWDANEARLSVASSRGDRAVIEQAFSVDLRPRPAKGDEEEEKVDIGERIASALATHGVGRMETLVAVGRASIELRQLSLPPAPDDELPEMVRFQAVREFGQFDEDWLLDFVPLDEVGEEGGPREVLAAAISPKAVKQIQQVCSKAGLTPQRMVLRSCAAASLLAQADPLGPDQPRLLIELLGGDAELTVMLGRKVFFLRNTRVGADPVGNPDQQRALLSEIRRTIAAAENQLAGRRVNSLALCGSGKAAADLTELIGKELGKPTRLFDPFGGLTLGGELMRGLPENPGRFAPLVGMAISEFGQTGHGIDFLHPRRRPAPPSRQSRYAAIGGAIAVLVVLFAGYRIYERSMLNREIVDLGNTNTELTTRLVPQAEQNVAARAAIDAWEGTDIIWLDELYRLSKDLPPAKQVTLTDLKLSGRADGKGGRIALEGLVKGVTTAFDVGASLDGDDRTVQLGQTRPDDQTDIYDQRFSGQVYLAREKK